MQIDLAHLERLALRGMDLHVVQRLDQLIRSGQFSLAGVRASIQESMARAAYTDYWIAEQERRREEHGTPTPWGPGDEITEYVPKTTRPSAKRWAKEVVAKYEAQTGFPIELLYWLAENAEGDHGREPTPDGFGWYLAMQAMGHGVSWWDDHPRFEPLASARVHAEYYG